MLKFSQIRNASKKSVEIDSMLRRKSFDIVKYWPKLPLKPRKKHRRRRIASKQYDSSRD